MSYSNYVALLIKKRHYQDQILADMELLTVCLFCLMISFGSCIVLPPCYSPKIQANKLITLSFNSFLFLKKNNEEH